MIEFAQVSKQFGSQEVLHEVSLRILTGERIGVVGPNGSGKSTLFSLIIDEVSPDAGTIEIQKGLRIGLVRQQLRAHAFDGSLIEFTLDTRPDLEAMHTRIDEIEHLLPTLDEETRASRLKELGELQSQYEHLGGYTLKSRAEAALCGLGFSPTDFSEPFRTFSGGWQMRAELVRTLLGDPDVLLLDEPSNYLDLPAIEWLQRRLSNFQGTMLLASHDRFLLRSICDVTVEVASAMVTRYPCRFDNYLHERAERSRIQEAAAQNQDKRREQIERFVERFRSKNTKASQVQSRIKMLEKMEDIRIPRLVTDAAYLRLAPPPHCGAEVLRLENAGLTYNGEQWILREIDLAIGRGEKIGFVGFNGMGKTTLLRILSGTLPPTEGARVLGHLVIPGYQSQDSAETMPPDQSVYRTVQQANPQAQEREIRTLLGGFGFQGDAIHKTCEVLSGGEKIRLAFARLFIKPPNLLLLDEPTTHLDIQGCQTLERALRDYEGTVCLVSHDIDFVRNVATSIIAMEPPGIRRYAGGYDYYKEKAGSEQAPPASRPTTDAGPSRSTSAKDLRRERAHARKQVRERTRELDRRIAKAEKRIAQLEEERAQHFERLASTDSTPEDRAEAGRRVKELEFELGDIMHAWEEDSLKREELASPEG